MTHHLKQLCKRCSQAHKAMLKNIILEMEKIERDWPDDRYCGITEMLKVAIKRAKSGDIARHDKPIG